MGIGTLDLGKAVFQLGVDAGQLASGLSDASAKISGFAGKAIPPLKNAQGAFEQMGDGVNGMTMKLERWSRGIRDVSPVVQRAQESVYAYRSEQKRLGESIEYTKQRLDDQIKSTAIYTDVTARRRALLDQLVAKETELQVKYQLTEQRIQNITATLATTNTQVLAQTRAVQDLTLAQDQANGIMQASDAAFKTFEGELLRLGSAEQAAASNIQVWGAELLQTANMIKYHTMEMGKLTKAGQTQSAQYQQHESELTRLKTAHTTLTADLASEQTAYTKINADLIQAQQAHSGEANTLAQAQALHAGITNKLTDESNKLNDLTHKESELDIELKTVNATLNTQAKYLSFANAKIDEQRDRVDRAVRQESQHQQAIDVTRKTLANKQNAMERLKNSLDLAKERLSALIDKEKAHATSADGAAASTKKMKTAEDNAAKSSDTFARSISSSSSGMQGFSSAVSATEQKLGGLGGMLQNIASYALGGLLTNAIQSVTSSMGGMVSTALGAYRSFEQTGAMLTSLVAKEKMTADSTLTMGQAMDQSKDRAAELQGWIQKLAIESPFGEDDVKGAFQQAMAYNFTSSQAQRLTSALLNMSAATGQGKESMDRASLALGQMHSLGRVTTEDMNQLTGAGIQVRQILAKEFGVTTEKLADMVTKGLVPADKAIGAITKSLENDFGQAAKNQSGTMEGLINSFQDLTKVDLRLFFSSTFDVLKVKLGALVTALQSPQVTQAIQFLGKMLGDVVGGAITFISDTAIPAAISAFNAWQPTIETVIGFLVALGQTVLPALLGVLSGLEGEIDNAMSYLSGLASDAYGWGSDLIGQFSDGIMAGVDQIYDAVSSIGEEIAYWLEPHSPPKILPKIDQWGTETMQLWADALGGVDFSALDNVANRVESFLNQMVNFGKVEQASVIPTVLQVRDVMAQAMDEFSRTGGVTEETFAQLRNSAGEAGSMLEAYARSMFAAQAATEAVSEAQDALNSTTQEYDSLLAPLEEQLRAVQDAQNQNSDANKADRMRAMLQGENTMGVDRDKIQGELDTLSIKDKIDNIQQEKTAAVNAAQDKLNAANAAQEAAQRDFQLQQNLLEVQSKQNDLLQKQADLLAQIAKQKDEDQKKADQQSGGEAKGSSSKRDQGAQDAEKAAEAEFNYKMSIADSDEKLRLLNERLGQTKQGSAEYYQVLKQIDDVKKEQTKTDDANTNAQLDYNMSVADADTRLGMLREQQGKYAEGSKEYIALQKQIDKVEEVKKKQQDEATKAQEDYNFSVADTASKLDILHARLEKTTKGSKEYYDTLKEIDSLEKQAERAGGKKKDKGPKGKDTPFEGLAPDKGGPGQAIGQIGNAFDGVNKKIAEFKERLQGVVAKINEFSDAIRIGAVVALGLLAARIASPYLAQGLTILRLALTALFSPLGILILLVGALYVAWVKNFGGIREIVADVWAKIQGPLALIGDAFKRILDAFQTDGISGAMDQLTSELPAIGVAIGNVLSEIGKGIVEWAVGIGPVLLDVARALLGTISGFLASTAGPVIETVGKVFVSLFGSLATQVGDALPGFTQGIVDLFEKIGDWFQKNGSMIFTALRLGLLIAFDQLVTAIVPAAVFVIKRLIDIAGWLVPLLPDLLGGVLNLISNLIGWIIGRGIPLAWSAFMDLFTYLLKKTGDILPTFGLSFGRMIGSVLSNLLISIVAGIGMLLAALWQSIKDGSFQRGLVSLLEALNSLIIGLLKGLLAFVIGLALGLVEPLVDAGRAMIFAMGEGWTGGWATFFRRLVAGFDSAMDWIHGWTSAKPLAEIGQSIVDGLRFGWDAAWEVFFLGVQAIWGGFVTWVKRFLGIASPSSVFLEIGSWLVRGFWEGINVVFGPFVLWFQSAVSTWVKAHLDELRSFMDAISRIWNAMIVGVRLIVNGFIKLLNGDFDGFWANIKGGFAILFAAVRAAANVFVAAFVLLVSGLRDGVKAIVETLAGKVKGALSDMWGDVKSTASGAVSTLKGIFDSLRDSLSSAGNAIRDDVSGAFDKLKERAGSALGGLKDAASTAMSRLRDYLTDGDGIIRSVTSAGASIGKGIVDGIQSGIAGAWDAFDRWVKDQIDKLPQAVREALGLNSPARVMIPVGSGVVEGIEVGMKSRMNTALSTADALANRLAGAMGAGAKKAMDGQPVTHNQTQTTTINNNMTVNTRAETSTVINDFGAMSALTGASRA